MTINAFTEELIRAVVHYGVAHDKATRQPIKLKGRIVKAHHLHISDSIEIIARPDGSLYGQLEPFIAVDVITDTSEDPAAYMVYAVTLQTALSTLGTVKSVEF